MERFLERRRLATAVAWGRRRRSGPAAWPPGAARRQRRRDAVLPARRRPLGRARRPRRRHRFRRDAGGPCPDCRGCVATSRLRRARPGRSSRASTSCRRVYIVPALLARAAATTSCGTRQPAARLQRRPPRAECADHQRRLRGADSCRPARTHLTATPVAHRWARRYGMGASAATYRRLEPSGGRGEHKRAVGADHHGVLGMR